MFNWATEKLEKLSQTVAPPPDDPTSRFVYCVQKNDEAGAQGCLAEIDPLHTIVQSTKGTTPLHLACAHSMVNLIRQILSIPGATTEVTDAAGNTPLHHASMSTDQANGVYVVKMLITEYNASVVAKNWQGQTPYDVATLNGIRQYLLPLQLQQETQQAIDNGGVGLPPGIDMGGLRISNPAMPPPPMGGNMEGGAPPPTPPNNAGLPNMMATPSPTVPPTTLTAPPAAQPVAPHSANAVTTEAAPTSGNGQLERSTSCSSAPSSGNSAARRTYSRSGSSSAAVLSKAKFRPDGFHSSSSDVSLQKKYGHSSHGTPAAAVPPPPSSGNSAGPPAVCPSSGANPYAAGSSAFGSANRYGGGAPAGRYPVYGAAPVARSSSGGYASQPAPVPSYAVFQPGAAQTQQQQQPTYPTTPFMSPPPYQQQQAAYQQPMTQQPQQQPMNAYQQPQAAYQQPQQMTQQPQSFQQPPAQVASPYQHQQNPTGQEAVPAVNAPTQQPYAAAQPSMPGPYPMAHTVSTGNTSVASAEEVFASPSKKDETNAPAVPAAEPTATRTVTEDSARSSISSAQELFATSAGEPNTDAAVGTQEQPGETSTTNQGAGSDSAEVSPAPAGEPTTSNSDAPEATAAATGTAADFFGSNGTGPTTSAADPAVVATAGSPTAEKAKEETGADEGTDGMDDVPLEEVPLTPSEGGATGPGTDQAAAFSSIGLPPPPFSSRQ